VIEIEDGAGGYLCEERFEDRRVSRDYGLEGAECRILLLALVESECLGERGRRGSVLPGVCVPEEVVLL
jgi:hypothetical protein